MKKVLQQLDSALLSLSARSLLSKWREELSEQVGAQWSGHQVQHRPPLGSTSRASHNLSGAVLSKSLTAMPRAAPQAVNDAGVENQGPFEAS
jgi:hypothetical protein